MCSVWVWVGCNEADERNKYIAAVVEIVPLVILRSILLVAWNNYFFFFLPLLIEERGGEGEEAGG